VSSTIKVAEKTVHYLSEGISAMVQADTSVVITILAQIYLNADCRTIRGFLTLLEKDWITEVNELSLVTMISVLTSSM